MQTWMSFTVGMCFPPVCSTVDIGSAFRSNCSEMVISRQYLESFFTHRKRLGARLVGVPRRWNKGVIFFFKKLRKIDARVIVISRRDYLDSDGQPTRRRTNWRHSGGKTSERGNPRPEELISRGKSCVVYHYASSKPFPKLVVWLRSRCCGRTQQDINVPEKVEPLASHTMAPFIEFEPILVIRGVSAHHFCEIAPI